MRSIINELDHKHHQTKTKDTLTTLLMLTLLATAVATALMGGPA